MSRLGRLGVAYASERPVRTGLVAASVALGVAVVLGVGAGVATVNRSVNGLGADLSADVVVSGVGAFGTRLPRSTLVRLSATDGVGTVAPVTAQPVVLTTGTMSADVVALGIPLDRVALLTAKASTGRLPTGEGEIAVSSRVAQDLHLRSGVVVTVGATRVRVVGVLSPGVSAAAGTDRVVLASPALVGPTDPAFGLIRLVRHADRSAWINSHSAAFSDVNLDDASIVRPPLRDLFTAISVGLSSVSVLTIGLAGFLIYLSLGAAVAQREHDYGVLFALGASRRQVATTVLAEAAAIGAVGSAAGVLLGIGLGRLFSVAISALFHLPRASLTLPPTTVVSAIAIGVAVSLLGALVPARRAASRAPIAAIGGLRERRAASTWRIAAGTTLVVLGIAGTLSSPHDTTRFGTALVLIGLPLLLPAIVGPIARLLRPAVRRLSPGLGDVAIAHIIDDRAQFASTTGLVAAALAVVVLTGAGYQSYQPEMRRYMQAQFGSDLQVFPPASAAVGTLPVDYPARVRAVPGVAAVSPMWHTETRQPGAVRRHILTVIDPDTYFQAADFRFVEGSKAATIHQLDRGGAVLVNYAIANSNHWKFGDTIALTVGPRAVRFKIAGTYAAFGDDYARAFVIGIHDGGPLLGLQGPNEIRVATTPTTNPHQLVGRLPAAGQLLTYRFGTDNVNQAMRQFNGVFAIFLIIAAMGGVVALLGVANTLAIAMIERAREIGMLRAVGAHTREIRRMVLGEAVTLIGVAFLVAVPVSVPLSLGTASTGTATFGFHGSNHYPLSWLPIIFLATVSFGVLAGIGPAERATRLNPIAALSLD